MDDAKLFTGSPMSIGDIQSFLNAKVTVCDTWGSQMHSSGQTRAQYSAANGVSTPFTCLKEARDTVQAKSAESGLCSSMAPGSGTAAEIIFWVSQACGINSQALIVLLQKEQSLITDDWPWPIQYRSATGYGCPDTAPCDSEYYGFFNQVYNAARQFKRYARDSHLFNFRAGMNANIQYNPNAGCGSSTVYIQNQATAALYNYTPYQPNAAALNNLYGTGDSCSAYGNRNFWRMFNDWFGSTYGSPDNSCKNGSNLPGGIGMRIQPARPTWGADRLSIVQLNSTSTGCIEVHSWANGAFNQWASHTATGRHNIDPNSAKAIAADSDGDGFDELTIVEMANTASGRIEMHTFASDNQRWAAHIASNRPVLNPDDSEVIAADTNGDGRDEMLLIDYRSTSSGRIEVHGWSSNYQQWVSHTATNRPAIDPGTRVDRAAEVVAADIDGNLAQEFMLVQYSYTGSGFVEVHGWNSGLQSWRYHTATSQGAYYR